MGIKKNVFLKSKNIFISVKRWIVDWIEYFKELLLGIRYYILGNNNNSTNINCTDSKNLPNSYTSIL